MSYLRIERLNKRYGETVVVDGLSIDVARGEFVSLLGPSGCGKTTTLQMIAGFVEPTAGDIILEGRSLVGVPPAKRGLGIVFQSYALFAHMTVAENVEFGLQMRRVDRAARKRQSLAALDLVQLGRHASKYPRELSGGQRQRVALARALVIEPPLLLLDEPLSNLDAKLRHDMQAELRAIQRKVGTTTVMVTHDQAEALAISDRVALLNQGTVVRFDTPTGVYDDPGSFFAADFIGRANVLRGQVAYDGTQHVLKVGPASLPLDAPHPCGEHAFSLRPERIALVESGTGHVDGQVSACAFQGNCWSVNVSTGIGELQVQLANSGNAVAQVGDAVGLYWQDTALRPLASPAAEGPR
ncbi:spermidine/putrescine ABC transporter ATPase [Burkholderia sp. MSh2]|uniref:Spermidine/putrescine ABC transporter ATPase n=1 Tax=Burkholderia paludis TaxID=1506587 RepID=A0A6P2RCM0_9BURK|nr:MULTISPECIES: ABC transporter ATP-binding protein [Burkholderia]KEZ06261.1 spermidine/putrescine ABC transporter ATPase [Burkholderia sp. MSh2]CAB3768142.1 Spermidine/putrescine import ATP-binding protein PotA [Burkholderia paludis]VWC30726.1 spermidine/putrescine ABC transporter ATPase [Burkholderia paludis]